MFSAIHAALFRLPPLRQPDRLAAIWGANLAGGGVSGMVATADYLDWQKQSHAFEQLALCGAGASQTTLVISGQGERVQWQTASPNLFQVLGVPPLVGTYFPESGAVNGARGAMLSYSYWQRRFGGDPHVSGRKILVNNRPAVIVGVMSPGFQIPAWG